MTPLLRIDNLKTILHTGAEPVRAVDGLTFQIQKGEIFALLGESGCGKSMAALSMMRLLPEAGEIVSGSIKLDREDLLLKSEKSMRSIRGKHISMIFQEPMLSLNPVLTVARQIGEVLKRHLNLHGIALQERIIEILCQVGISDATRRMTEYPFQFSGGMKQRVMIAMALACEPELLIADEPTTALDVTIQAQVLDLMRSLQRHKNMAILLITHDLGVVSEMADRIAVMYAGEIVEIAARDRFFNHPAHPYSQKLFAALPGRSKRGQGLAMINGNVPPLSAKFIGCRFSGRCEYAWNLCRTTAPEWSEVTTGHKVRCHLHGKDNEANVKSQVIVEKSSLGVIPVFHSITGGSALLNVTNLKVYFPIYKGLIKSVAGHVKAVDGVSLSISQGSTLALVGESGCGKTTVGKSILQLITPTAGSVHYDGLELVGLERKQLRRKRAEFQIIFQDPYSSLNPRMRIIDILEEGMYTLNTKDDDNLRNGISQINFSGVERIDELLKHVGLPPESKWRYPHEFSGGQRQRIAIARTLAVNPKLLICDEPTSALDVSVQAQILNLLKELQQGLGLAYLFITHNISVVEYLADEVAVMYLGRIVEYGNVDEVLNSPKHPYTQALLSAVPVVKLESNRKIIHLNGDLPSPANPPSGCHFHPRCPKAMPVCSGEYPAVTKFSETHTAYCYLYDKDSSS
jgi:peptide/nickel transport system ATP-binding protein